MNTENDMIGIDDFPEENYSERPSQELADSSRTSVKGSIPVMIRLIEMTSKFVFLNEMYLACKVKGILPLVIMLGAITTSLATLAGETMNFKAHVHEKIGVQVSPAGLLVTSSHVEHLPIVVHMKHDFFDPNTKRGSCSAHVDIHNLVNFTLRELSESYSALLDTEYNAELLAPFASH